MSGQESVKVRQITKLLAVEVGYGKEYLDRDITSSEISRPGLLLTGFEQIYPHDRIQLIGKTEMSYINAQTSEERTTIFETMCSEETPAVVITRDLNIPDELIPVADKYHFPILQVRYKTSRTLANLTNLLERFLAERTSRHGVFLEVFGMGVMLTGASGVGKSETAMELIQRGHRLVADDRVELYEIDELTLMGEAPEILQNFIELRGLGIIDVQTLYGVAAIRRTKQLELIIDLVLDDGTIQYERLGYEHEYEQIFNVKVPRVKIPVKSGRNLAVIVESAAMNFRALELGYDAREEFNTRLDALIFSNREVD